MKCENCPMQWCESNESTYPAQYGCEYGEDYYYEHSIEFKDGSDGCLKRRKTIQRDMDINTYSLPEKFTEINMKNYKGTLYDFLGYWSDDFDFDIFDEFGQLCYWGLKSDINGILNKALHKVECDDVVRCFNFTSTITRGNYYRMVLNISIDELRGR